MATERLLETEKVEGEISLVIDYVPGQAVAIDVLKGAMNLIEALDQLDRVLLSSVDTSLEPVSILNDVQHSSLKMLLARALRKVPDNHLGSLEWKKWVGEILVKGKYLLLDKLDADTPELATALHELEDDYKRCADGSYRLFPSFGERRARRTGLRRGGTSFATWASGDHPDRAGRRTAAGHSFGGDHGSARKA